jgi:hypothetical protein
VNGNVSSVGLTTRVVVLTMEVPNTVIVVVGAGSDVVVSGAVVGVV